MALPKEPRQKMINIMYLVLTALLALNVSKQVVHAFIVVNNGLQLTNKNTMNQNEAMMVKFQKAFQNDMVKAKPFLDAATEISKKSDEMVNDIQKEKQSLIQRVDGAQWTPDKWTLDKRDTNLEYVQAQEDFTTPTGILLGTGEDVTKGEANKLKLELNSFRREIVKFFNNPALHTTLADTVNVKIGLLTPKQYSPGEGMQTWEYYYFGDAPLVSDVVFFTKLQNDVRNAEAAMLNYLFQNIDAKSFKVTDFIAKIIPSSNYIMLGDSFKADIFPSAYIATQQPKIFVGGTFDSVANKPDPKDLGTPVDKFDNKGIGKYGVKTDHEGSILLKGYLQMKDPTGVEKYYAFHTSYIVAKAAVVISPSEMNVFYAGIPNPVDISVPGVDAGSLTASISGGSIVPSTPKGHYNVNVSSEKAGTEATITVTARMPDGSRRSLPGQKFRIKRIPDPECYTAGKKGGGGMSKLQIKANPKVEARMPEDFSFGGVTWQVTTFKMAITVGNQVKELTSPSGNFTPEMMSLVNQAPSGTLVLIEGVQARGPGGQIRPISGMGLKIN